MKKMLLIMMLVIVTLMGRSYVVESNYKAEIEQLKAENAELQDTVYELDSEIQILLDETELEDLPVYDDTVDEEAEWASWDNLQD